MTEKDTNQPENPTNDKTTDSMSNRTEKMPHARSTFDLRSAADEAIQMLNASQMMDAQQPELSEEDSTAPVPELNRSEAESLSSSAEASVDEKPIDIGTTTHDVTDYVQEAMAMPPPEPVKRKLVEFDSGMNLQIDVIDSTQPMILDVTKEMLVGRADNVTDYIPDIDLTPHGAYRLGLSRRHATISCLNNRLIVQDLNSRNGTFVNGQALEKGSTQELADGDELRFGNLGMRISFVAKS